LPDIAPILKLLESKREEDRKAGTLQLRAFAKEYARNIRPLYHVIPWSERILSEDAFRALYARTVELTGGLRKPTSELLAETLRAFPPSLMVFRLVSGYQWEELADIVELLRGVKIRKDVLQKVERGDAVLTEPGIAALATTLFEVIGGREMKLPETLDPANYRTRNTKVDTKEGWSSVAQAIKGPLDLGHVLYERYTGRPFAYVRDALSESKGGILEAAIAALFKVEDIPFEAIEDNRLEGFSQAPDFVLPSRAKPVVLIEAKLSEDGGTSRDKAGRIEKLFHEIGDRPIALIAVVDGKGFRRINDTLAPILKHTRGQTFFLGNLDQLAKVPAIARLKRR
jgi:hypothetical protein